jgi:PAS domain S-box-containing protein
LLSPKQHPADQLSPDRLRARVNLALSCVFLLFAMLWGLLLWYRLEQGVEQGERRADNLALMLSEHLRRSADAVDGALVQLAQHSQRVGGPGAAPESWASVLQTALAGLEGIGAISVIDETGVIRVSTDPGLIGQSRADQFLFRQLAANPRSRLMAGGPIRNLASDRLVLPLGRPLTTPDGQFAGLIAARLEAERLREFYRSVDVGPNGVITVLHPLGIVLIREPSNNDPIGEPPPSHPIFQAQQQKRDGGLLRGPLRPDGPKLISAYRTIPHPTLILAVSLAEHDILAGWRNVTLIALGLTIALGFALLVSAYLIKRETRDRTAAMVRLMETDAALRASQQRLRAMMEHAPLLVAEKGTDGRFTFVNRAFEERLGIPATQAVGKTVHEIFSGARAEAQSAIDQEVLDTKAPVQRELVVTSPTGPLTLLFTKFPLLDAAGDVEAIGSIAADVTDLKHAEAQLAHVQKMEAIGQLTGGVAHDFNNLLTAILLNSDVLADRIQDDRLRPLAEATRAAAERGADLTRRLLAFGRRQTLEPRPTDINALVHGMEQLLRRTLHEHIAIEFRPAPDLWPAKVDPGQIEAAVINLAVNARDAMPQGGRITIETSNVEVDETYASRNVDATAGDYVLIALTDTGTGMTSEVVARAFEPFFTTKDVGKGTGLGLSMVYGFLKQSGGHARIYSEVGIGTTVKLYLPRSDVPAEVSAMRAPVTRTLPTGGESILLVEDDPLVRKHTESQLIALGYKVLAAENAAGAIALVENATEPDLLFTDIVMPGAMNGRQLADKLRQRWPALKVLYTSGFSHGMLDGALGGQIAGKYLLGKPFRRADLANKIREILDEPAEEAAAV